MYRMYAWRCHYLDTRASIVTSQACVRGYLVRRAMHANTEAAIVMQKYVRGFLARKHVSVMVAHRRTAAATTIQRSYRGHVVRTSMRQRLAHIVTVQAHIRRWLARKECKDLSRARQERLNVFCANVRVHMAAIRLQRMWRRCVVTMRAARQMHAIVTVQRWWRCVAARTRTQRQQQRACVTIQSFWRGCVVRLAQQSKKYTLMRQRVRKANANVEVSCLYICV